jgi:HK97 family phage prohead protease
VTAPTLIEDVLTRSVAPDDVLFQRDGLVRALMVPWMRPADITEIRGGRLLEYREQFARGAFERAERNPHRVQLVWTHDDQFANVLGRGVEFVNDPAGAIGIFRLFPSVADKARDALEGSPVSITFRTIRPQFGSERPGDLVTRTEAHLRNLAAVDSPAYADAQVLAIREADQEAQERAAAQAESDRILAATLARLKATGNPLPAEQERWLAEHPTP